ncbi:MAG TPA: phosphoribosylaminoimidazolesuccinocarboxamide synthase [Bacteroidota bacterium]|nr:phosphoribosylaminoimidazolesuccinocarboxamide synthase [Bacteroidota bacterium]
MNNVHNEPVITGTSFAGLGTPKKGKVRDLYDLGDSLLIVATDRLSAYDVILPQGIPFKGKVLTKISEFWFDKTQEIIPNHLTSTIVYDYPSPCKPYWDQLSDRSMLVKKTKPLPVECVVRGYLSGSGWNDYRESGSVCGVALPKGLAESAKLSEPIFTPATKEEVGVHDQNISFEQMASIVGKEIATRVRDFTIAVYLSASKIAESKGIIIADTKMEFGIDASGNLILIDELLTPDSSRFWPKDRYMPGKAQPSYDKQFVRDYLLSIDFNKKPPGPKLPEEVIFKTSALYLEALRILTGKTLI